MSKKSIALVFPQSTFLESKLNWMPLGILYIGAQLEKLGHKCEFFDLNCDNMPKDGDFDYLLLSSTAPQIREVKRIAYDTLGWTKTKKVLGGAGTWANPKTHNYLPFDLIVGGEADHPDSVQYMLDLLSREKLENNYITFPTAKDLDWVLPPLRRWSYKYNSVMKDVLTGEVYNMTSAYNTRGCPLTCIEENQKVLMADWTYKPIKDVQIGDMVMAMYDSVDGKKHKKIKPTRVVNKAYNGNKDVIKLTTDKTSVVCTPDHKIYVDDGHKTRWKRADSSITNKTKVRTFLPLEGFSDNYKRGWLAGYIAGDGCIHYRKDATQITITSRDVEMLDTLREWATLFGCKLRKFKHRMGNDAFPTGLDSTYIDAVQCTSGVESDKFLDIILKNTESKDYWAGWLAGMYDSDGTLNVNVDCRIFQSYEAKPYNCEKIEYALNYLKIHYNKYEYHTGMYSYVLNMSAFLTTCRPQMKRKYPDEYSYRNLRKDAIKSVENIGKADVYDIETEAHSFICEGFIVHNCAFCEVGRFGVIFGERVRYEPIEVVEAQVKEIKDLGYTGINFYDDVKPLSKKKTQEFLQVMKKYGLKWRCFLRSDIICNQGGKEYLQEMRDAGLIEIFVGIESADNQIKDNVHKKTTIEQDENILKWCRELGIVFKGSFILGLPGENYESMNKTRDWILNQNPENIRIQVGRLIPFAGTPLGDRPEEFDITYTHQPDDNWFYAGNIENSSFVSTSHLSVEQIDEFWKKLQSEMKERGFVG